MNDLPDLIQDLRAHAHEAPAVCAALMRRAAATLERNSNQGGKHRRPTNGEATAHAASDR